MRVALVNNLYVDQLGYFYIAAALKRAGHDVQFFATSRHLENELHRFGPELVGLTAVTGNHQWAASVASEIKTWLPGTRTILGGPHPTYHPRILEHTDLDYICRGEGELAVVALAAAIGRGDAGTGIAGISARDGGRIVDGGVAPPIEDLDGLPFPDRSMYERMPLARRAVYPLMLSSRGCPFRCTFCYAPTMADMVKGRGKFVRFRSVDNVLAEAVELRRRYECRSIEFVDDIFGMHRPWLREFAPRWAREVGVGFQCNLRADLIDEEAAALLAEAGCRAVAFGLEAGSERVRNRILQKDVSDHDIDRSVTTLRRHGIKIITLNILGSPGETFEEAWQTLRMNQRLRPDYAAASIMSPYPGTRIYDVAVEQGSFDREAFDEVGPSFWGASPLKLAHRREITNLQKLFFLAVRFPWLTPLVRRLVRLPENAFFYVVYTIAHVYWFWYRTKAIPSLFVVHVLLNAQEMWRRHQSGLYRRRLPQPPASGPTLRERMEIGAI